MKKFSKIGKRVLAFFLVALMNINTYAAVGGNDGSAFVTKAEFDALVNTFNEQMDTYESGLNTKIDGAIANYLSSLTNKKHVEITTGIDIETDGGAKTLRFVKSTAKHLNMDQTQRGNDTIQTQAIGTYRKLSAYEQDTYDTLIYRSTNSLGSNNNLLCLIDSENVVDGFKINARADVNRNLVFYSTTDAINGLSWTTVKAVYGLPTALYSDSSVYQSSLTATGRAFKRGSSSGVWNRQANGKVFAMNDCDATTGDTTNYTSLDTNRQNMWYTADNHNQNIAYTLRNTIVNFFGTNQNGYVDHWAQGSSYKLKTSDKEWGEIAMLANGYSAATNYTVNIQCRYQSGPGAYNTIWPTVTTQGMGIKFNTTDKDVNEIYYRNIKDVWDQKISYAGGFPLYYSDTEDEATITIPLQLSTQATVTIMNTQRTSFPADGSDDIIPFQYRPVGGNWVNVGQKSVLLGGSEFEFKFNMSKGQIAYLDAKWETADANLLITQTGKAYLDTDE